MRHQLQSPSWLHISKTSEASTHKGLFSSIILASNFIPGFFQKCIQSTLKDQGQARQWFSPQLPEVNNQFIAHDLFHHTSLQGDNTWGVEKVVQAISGGNMPGLLPCEQLSYWHVTLQLHMLNTQYQFRHRKWAWPQEEIIKEAQVQSSQLDWGRLEEELYPAVSPANHKGN